MEWPQQVMVFSIENELYACPLKAIRRVLPAEGLKIFSVQINLPSLYGYCISEETMLPLVDIRILFRQLTVEPSLETSILVTQMKSLDVGLRCDSVSSVITPESDLVRLPEPLLLEARDYFQGIFLHRSEMVLLIDPDRIFLPGDLELMAETAKTVQRNISASRDYRDPGASDERMSS
ncbi:chemotaxis protein CheW [bacterium]|nr:chemotaxis protein CheW [bacterium]